MKLIKILFQSILVEIYLWTDGRFFLHSTNECLPCASGSTVLRRDSVWIRDCGMGRWWKVSVTVTLPKDPMPGPPWSLFLHWSSSHRSGSLSLRTCIGGQRIQSLPWLFWDICKQVEGRKSALCFCVSCMSTWWVTRGPFRRKYRHWFLATSKILKSGSEFLGGYGVAYRRGGKGKLPDLKMAHSTREQGGRKRQTPWGTAIQWITFSHLPFFIWLLQVLVTACKLSIVAFGI